MYLKLWWDLPPKSFSQELSSPDQSAELKQKTRLSTGRSLASLEGAQLSALFKLEVPGLSSASLQEVGPVSLSFELLKYTCTGLQIRFLCLSLIQPGPLHRWVLYVTHSASYTIRI
uniref:MHD domain-containing protein n=1 Tax=Hucho hucho TaxID=62062 RepID=A0A4W5LK37_9TELE